MNYELRMNGMQELNKKEMMAIDGGIGPADMLKLAYEAGVNFGRWLYRKINN